MRRRFFLWSVVVLLLCSVLYGVTYQQFRHFDTSDPRGLNDSASYLRMSHGDYDVWEVHRYRFVVPLLARGVRAPLAQLVRDHDELERLSFYIVNFAFTLGTSLLLLGLLQHLGFEMWLAILGAVMFMTSRVTVALTGAPLVDSFFFCSMLGILLLTLTKKSILLALLMPLFALSKEAILPFLLIPLLTRMRTSKCYWVSLPVSLGAVYCVRHVLGGGAAASGGGFDSVVRLLMERIWGNTAGLFTIRGLHDFQNGFSFFLVLALLGFVINRRQKLYNIPILLQLLIPLSLCYACLSGNYGRMFFVSFPVVIPYALICLDYACRREKGDITTFQNQ
jgi:hypothetical protein